MIKTPFTRAKNICMALQIFGTVLTILRHGTLNFWRVNVSVPHVMWHQPVLKILGVPRLPLGGSLGTGKRGTVPKIWHAVPIFLGHANGVQTSVFFPPGQFKNCARWFTDDFNLSCRFCVVYLIMLIQGVGTLLPWNMFITAHAVSTQ